MALGQGKVYLSVSIKIRMMWGQGCYALVLEG